MTEVGKRIPTFIVAIALLVVACDGGDGSAPTTTSSTGPTAAPSPTTTIAPLAPPITPPSPTTVTTTLFRPELGTPQVVYFLMEGPADALGPHLVPVWRDATASQGLAGAIETLLAGPTPAERGSTISTGIPPTTSLIGVEVDESGLASIDLSGDFEAGGGTFSMQARLAQMVFTATRYPGVEAVSLLIDGELVRVFSAEGIVIQSPLTRTAFIDLLPPIFVDDPPWGGPIDHPARLRGEAQVTDAEFITVLSDADGEIIAEFPVSTSPPAFNVALRYSVEVDQSGTLLVFTRGPGGPENARAYPVLLQLPQSGALCSAAGLSAEPVPQVLPEAVAATRAAVIEAAVACDFQLLAAIAEQNPFFTLSFGADEDPAEFWRSEEAAGIPLTRLMVQLLNTPPVLDSDFPEPTYLWPSAFRATPTEEDWTTLEGILPADEIQLYRDFGTYLGLRLGINESGVWEFAVAGD